MKISTKGRYGLRLMVELGTHYGKGPVAADTIAKNQEISGQYLHVIAPSLRAAGLLRTVRGPGGGYELARSPSSITALDVVLALEGSNAPVECVVDATICSRAKGCPAREVWCDIAAAVDGVLSEYSIERLSARLDAKKGKRRRFGGSRREGRQRVCRCDEVPGAAGRG